MDDCDMLDAFPPTASQHATRQWVALSQKPELVEDEGIVTWKPSQSRCIALNNLMQDAYSNTEKHTASKPFSSLLTPTHNTSPAPNSHPRSLTRTPSLASTSSISRKQRPTRRQDTDDTNYVDGDPQMLLELLQMVSKTVDDNARMKRERLERITLKEKGKVGKKGVGPVMGIMKTTSEELGDRTNLRASTGASGSVRVGKAIKRSGSIQRAWSSGDLGLSMDIDVSAQPESGAPGPKRPPRVRPSRVPAPIVPPPSSADLMPPPGHIPAKLESTDTGNVPVKRKTARLKTSPLATQPKAKIPLPRNACPSSPILPPSPVAISIPVTVAPPPSTPSPTPSHSPLSASQQRIPRALGMRRTLTRTGSSGSGGSLLGSQGSAGPNGNGGSFELPTKRKGFKVPFAKPPGQTQGVNGTGIGLGAGVGSGVVKGERVPVVTPPSRESSPEPMLREADSSYGDIDISVDMDILEETMREYD